MNKSNAIEWANLRTAVINACKLRKDPEGHAKACMADLREVDPKEHKWWLAYFEIEGEIIQ